MLVLRTATRGGSTRGAVRLAAHADERRRRARRRFHGGGSEAPTVGGAPRAASPSPSAGKSGLGRLGSVAGSLGTLPQGTGRGESSARLDSPTRRFARSVATAAAPVGPPPPVPWQMPRTHWHPVSGDSFDEPQAAQAAGWDYLAEITHEIFAGADPLSDHVHAAELYVGTERRPAPGRVLQDTAALMFVKLEAGDVVGGHALLRQMFVRHPEDAAVGPWRDPRLHFAVLSHLMLAKDDWRMGWDWYCLSVGRRQPPDFAQGARRGARWTDLGLADYSALPPLVHGTYVMAVVARGLARAYERAASSPTERSDVLRTLEIVVSDLRLLFGTDEAYMWRQFFSVELAPDDDAAVADWAVFRRAAEELGIAVPEPLPEVASELDELLTAREDEMVAQEEESDESQLRKEEEGSLGVRLIRQLLSHLEPNTGPGGYRNQVRLESSARALSQFESHLEISKLRTAGVLRMHTRLGRLMWAWHTALKAELERELAAPGRAPEHVELLRHLKPHTMSSVAVVTVLRCLQSSGLAAMPDSSAEAAFEADYSGATMAALVNVCQLIGRGVEVEHGLASLETASDGAARRAARQLEAVLRKARGERSSFASLLAVRGAVARAERETKEGIRAGDWSLVMQVKVGAYLLDLLVKTARIDIDDFGAPREPVPCFEVATARKKGSWRIGILRTKNGLTKILSSEPVSSEPVYLPMVVKPKPWVSYNSGGYYTIPVDVVRLQTTDREALQLIKDADERGHLDRVYLGLDILGDTPWKVNDQVLAVVQDLWATGEAVAGLPSGIPIEVPPEPTETDRLELGPDEFRALRRQYLAAAKAEMERYSMRCSESYAVEIARSFAGRTLYFPHNVDFRGRAYPIPTHLNHMRNDLTRGLLSFGQGRKLGARGFWWLHVHMANVCGTNKLDLEGRKAWTEARMEDILDSADNPLTGRKWWMAQEKPFQCLAACIELAAAMRHPDGPEEYVSFLPVHQDGTCNGLQHYAALGGDREGGKQVNVVPGPKPGDVYSGVAEIVAKLVRKDYERAVQEEALTGNKPTDPDLVAATLMHDKITRKLIKQTVMTNTYGVTLIGAKDQIRARLRENRGKDHDMDEEQISRCALYVAHKVFAALGQTFAGAKKLQAWMNDTAALIGKSINQTHLPKHAVVRTEVVRKMGLLPASANAALEEASASDGHASLSIAAASSSATEEGSAARYDAVRLPFSSLVTIGPIESDDSSPDTVAATQPVTWTSPVGLPVMQPYRKLGQSRIQTALAAITVNDPTKPGPVNARKQSTAFPPNFVHSLDAAHMLFTAISMKQANLAFAAVHDSFWTHAVDVDEMSRIIREEFVRVHEGGEVLKALYREFVARYSALGQCSPVKLRMTVAQAKAVEAEVARIMDTKAKAVRRKKGAWDPDSVSVAPEGEEPTVEMEVWTQLAVPELPQRGPLDIREVLDSTFFFH